MQLLDAGAAVDVWGHDLRGPFELMEEKWKQEGSQSGPKDGAKEERRLTEKLMHQRQRSGPATVQVRRSPAPLLPSSLPPSCDLTATYSRQRSEPQAPRAPPPRPLIFPRSHRDLSASRFLQLVPSDRSDDEGEVPPAAATAPLVERMASKSRRGSSTSLVGAGAATDSGNS